MYQFMSETVRNFLKTYKNIFYNVSDVFGCSLHDLWPKRGSILTKNDQK